MEKITIYVINIWWACLDKDTLIDVTTKLSHWENGLPISIWVATCWRHPLESTNILKFYFDNFCTWDNWSDYYYLIMRVNEIWYQPRILRLFRIFTYKNIICCLHKQSKLHWPLALLPSLALTFNFKKVNRVVFICIC